MLLLEQKVEQKMLKDLGVKDLPCSKEMLFTEGLGILPIEHY